MCNHIWNQFPNSDQKLYIERLRTLGALSGLFKELDGANGRKPYLNYRNHEITYIKSFNVHGITRKDSAFDAIAVINGDNIGIGLKTWIHSTNTSFQKVAEFNKDSAELRKLFEEQRYTELVNLVSQLRNIRIEEDVRLYATKDKIYHIVTRDNDCMYITEEPYDDIDLECLQVQDANSKSILFTDGINEYKFMMSKSTLFKKFNTSEHKRIISFDVSINENPFLILDSLFSKYAGSYPLAFTSEVESLGQHSIYLPLYADRVHDVPPASRFNASLGKPKVKGSNTPRPEYEAYLQIDKFIHLLFPKFFNVSFVGNRVIPPGNTFALHLPNGKKYPARLTQDNAKGLQTSPQAALGRWMLYNIFGLEPYERLTKTMLEKRGVDCVKVTKHDNFNYSVDIADFLDYERWKLNLQPKIETLLSNGLLHKQGCPVFRPELINSSTGNK